MVKEIYKPELKEKIEIKNSLDKAEHVILDNYFEQKETGKLIDSGKEWSVTTYGAVERETIDAVKKTVAFTLKELGSKEANPEIKISEGEIILPDGSATSAILEITDDGKKIIRLSIKGAKSCSAYSQGLDKNIVLAIFAAHESTHYDQSFRKYVNMGELHAPDQKSRIKLIKHPLEVEANKIAEKVIKKIYNVDISFSE
jgi:hypothetical protein